MISNTLRESALSGKLPQRKFSKQAVYSVRNGIQLYDFCNWFAPEDFDFHCRSECRLLRNRKVVIGANKNFAHDFGDGVTYDYFRFCQEFLGLSFYAALYLGHEFLKEDIAIMSGPAVCSCSTTPAQLQADVDAGLYFIDKTAKAPYAYLCGVRHIDRQVVHDLMDSGGLYLKPFSRTYNLCFPFREHNTKDPDSGKLTGFEIVGATSSVRFKNNMTAKGNAYFAYILPQLSRNATAKREKLLACQLGQPCELVCFESVIDLLSFASLVRLGKVDPEGRSLVLVSMRGLGYNISEKAKGEWNAKTVHYFVDNDDAARSFLSRHALNAAPSQFLGRFPTVKDWNDLLASPAGGSMGKTFFSDIVGRP